MPAEPADVLALPPTVIHRASCQTCVQPLAVSHHASSHPHYLVCLLHSSGRTASTSAAAKAAPPTMHPPLLLLLLLLLLVVVAMRVVLLHVRRRSRPAQSHAPCRCRCAARACRCCRRPSSCRAAAGAGCICCCRRLLRRGVRLAVLPNHGLPAKALAPIVHLLSTAGRRAGSVNVQAPGSCTAAGCHRQGRVLAVLWSYAHASCIVAGSWEAASQRTGNSVFPGPHALQQQQHQLGSSHPHLELGLEGP